MGNNIAVPPPRAHDVGRCKKQRQNADYRGETWVAGKAKLISPREAASQGEPMLWECNVITHMSVALIYYTVQQQFSLIRTSRFLFLDFYSLDPM